MITENGFSDEGGLDDRDRVGYITVSGSNSEPLSMGINVYVSEFIHLRVYCHKISLVYRGYKGQYRFIVLFCHSVFYDFN